MGTPYPVCGSSGMGEEGYEASCARNCSPLAWGKDGFFTIASQPQPVTGSGQFPDESALKSQ